MVNDNCKYQNKNIYRDKSLIEITTGINVPINQCANVLVDDRVFGQYAWKNRQGWVE